MTIDIVAHYWPNTPELREIKLKVEGNVILSSFMNIYQVADLAHRLGQLQASLSRTVDDIYHGNS